MTNLQTNKSIRNVSWNDVIIENLAENVYEAAQENVANSDTSVKDMKNLTLNIMNDVSEEHDTQLMLKIAKTIEYWRNDKTLHWKRILSTFARKFDNINMIYTGQCETGKDIIIVVDNICSDEVFQYNDFCFELMDDFPDIGNFMIFDEAEFKGMEYKNYTKMYQKGKC